MKGTNTETPAPVFPACHSLLRAHPEIHRAFVTKFSKVSLAIKLGMKIWLEFVSLRPFAPKGLVLAF